MAKLRLTLAVTAAWLPLAAGAVDSTGQQDALTLFATCTGRLSALMEHQWLTDGPQSEETARTRARMIGLLETVMPPGAGAEVLHRRIEAKMAQAALLGQATFATDPRRAATARRLAALQLAQCERPLL